MNIEKFTERSQGFIQAAQGLAQRRDHQRLMPEHLLKILLDDKDGLAANLIRNAGGDPAVALRGVILRRKRPICDSAKRSAPEPGQIVLR